MRKVEKIYIEIVFAKLNGEQNANVIEWLLIQEERNQQQNDKTSQLYKSREVYLVSVEVILFPMANLKLFLGLLVCVAFASCAKAPDIDSYIIGGQTARPNQFPFVVSLRTLENFHFCGAGILSDRWLMSAAHCMQEDRAEARNVIAVIGAHHRANDGQPLRVDTIVNHPKFNRPWLRNDICVIRTTQAITFVPGRIQPVRLPPTDFTAGSSVRVWLAGWGFSQVCYSIFRKALQNIVSDV